MMDDLDEIDTLTKELFKNQRLRLDNQHKKTLTTKFSTVTQLDILVHALAYEDFDLAHFLSSELTAVLDGMETSFEEPNISHFSEGLYEKGCIVSESKYKKSFPTECVYIEANEKFNGNEPITIELDDFRIKHQGFETYLQATQNDGLIIQANIILLYYMTYFTAFYKHRADYRLKFTSRMVSNIMYTDPSFFNLYPVICLSSKEIHKFSREYFFEDELSYDALVQMCHSRLKRQGSLDILFMFLSKNTSATVIKHYLTTHMPTISSNFFSRVLLRYALFDQPFRFDLFDLICDYTDSKFRQAFDDNCRTPLDYAIELKNLELASYLRNKNFSVFIERDHPYNHQGDNHVLFPSDTFLEACDKGDIFAVKLGLEKGEDLLMGIEALRLALKQGHRDLAFLLLQQKIHPSLLPTLLMEMINGKYPHPWIHDFFKACLTLGHAPVNTIHIHEPRLFTTLDYALKCNASWYAATLKKFGAQTLTEIRSLGLMIEDWFYDY